VGQEGVSETYQMQVCNGVSHPMDCERKEPLALSEGSREAGSQVEGEAV